MELSKDLFRKLEDNEKNSEFIAVQSRTYLQDAWIRFRRNKLALAGLVFITIMILGAIFVPILSRYTYEGQDIANRHALPSAAHWFGTDKFGRDIFVRIFYGARISLSIGFLAAFINLCIGIVYGGISGFVGGRVDLFMMRVVDILYSVPEMLYVILIMVVLGSNMTSILIGICISSWVGMARLVRTQVLSLKQQEFSLAAQVMGASNTRILFKHLIVNSIGPIIVSVTMMVPSAIFTEAFLSMVGIGISIPMSSWGTMANEARELYQNYPIEIIWPIACICLTMLSLNFIGDGLGDSLDPNKK
ncbi:MAG: ABC transporter permease [Erysipelotrichaceae bacterium]|jgi:oligopeptide transport system permease protein|nr:ABC transporter permease [Erysipelotrichaceae bacterium]